MEYLGKLYGYRCLNVLRFSHLLQLDRNISLGNCNRYLNVLGQLYYYEYNAILFGDPPGYVCA
jgi:hypothetical protein